MKHLRNALSTAVLAALVFTAGAASGQLKKGGEAPSILAMDVHGRRVDLQAIIDQNPALVVQFFFTAASGKEVALKLRKIHQRYGRDQIKIVGVGFEDETSVLQSFVEDYDIDFHVVDGNRAGGQLANLVDVFPTTLFVEPDENRTIIEIFKGGSREQAGIIKEIALTFLQKGQYDIAQELTQESIASGEDDREAHRVRGFIYTAEGKLDLAEAEFGSIGATEGLAKVALERGQYEKAIALADRVGAHTGYGDTVKGAALMRMAKLDEAALTLERAVGKIGDDWQRAEALTYLGRIQHEQGNYKKALDSYGEAIAIDPYYVEALSNEAAIHRENGDLDKAQKALEQAEGRRSDGLVSLMLRQIRDEMTKANDVKRGELIRNTIKDLEKRYKEIKASGQSEPVDEWTTRPLIVAFLPSSDPAPVFFERAGTEVVVRRQIEADLQGKKGLRVVERTMLDQLLQELNLGASDLVNKSTQLQLGRVLSARALGVIDFAQVGDDTLIYLRFLSSETTEIDKQFRVNLRNASSLADSVAKLVADVEKDYLDAIERRGLIADAEDESAVIINLGEIHGVEIGDRFTVFQEGDPIEVGGKVVGRRRQRIATLEVTEVSEGFSICNVAQKTGNSKLAKDMKIQQINGS